MNCICQGFYRPPNCPVHGTMGQTPIKTLFELIQKTRPEVFHFWDKWDYKIYSPLSLDDEPIVVVQLINKNHSKVGFRFSLNPTLQEVVTHGSTDRKGTKAVPSSRRVGQGKV